MARRLTPAGEGRLYAAVLLTGLAVAGAILVTFARRLYFFGDDWAFLLTRGSVEGTDLDLFAPHNEHWTTLPILLYRGLFAVFGLDQYLPYALPVILAHLALAALTYVVLVRLGSHRGPALVAALALAFFGGGADNTLWDFQIAFVAPLMFAMSAVLAWQRFPASVKGVVVAGVCLVLALMCSGVGIASVVLVVVFVALTNGIRSAIAVGAGPTLVFLGWYAAIGHTAASASVADKEVYLQVPSYVWTGLVASVERASGIDGSGPVLLVVLVVTPFVIRDVSPGVRALAIAGVATALFQFLLQAWSRVGMGVEQATEERYAYLTVALLLPSFAVACGWLGGRLQGPGWVPALLATLVGLGYVVQGIGLQHAFVESRLDLAPDLQRQLRGIQAVITDDGPVLTEQPFPTYQPDITVALLDSPEARAALPPNPLSGRTELEGQSLVNVGVGGTSFGLPEARDLRTGRGLVASGDAGPDCERYVASRRGAVFELDSPADGSQFTVTGDANFVTTQLLRDGVRTLPHVQRVTPGQPLYVAVRVPDATLRVSFDKAGAYTVCPTPDTAPVS